MKLHSFPATRTTWTRIGVSLEGDVVRIENEEPRPVDFFGVNISKLPGVTVDGGVIWLRAQVKCERLVGEARFNLAARWNDGSVLMTEDGEEVTGTSDWVWRQARLPLKDGQRPDFVNPELFVNGKGSIWFKDVELLYDPPGKSAIPAHPPTERVRVFSTRDVPLASDVPEDPRGWRIDAKGDRGATLFEVIGPLPKGPGFLVWRAKMKTEDVTGEAYLEAFGRTEDGQIKRTKGDTRARGTVDWTYYEVAVPMKDNQMPSVTRLSVLVKGKGTVWVKAVELLKRPPVSKGRAMEEPASTVGDKSKEFGPPPREVGDPPAKK